MKKKLLRLFTCFSVLLLALTCIDLPMSKDVLAADETYTIKGEVVQNSGNDEFVVEGPVTVELQDDNGTVLDTYVNETGGTYTFKNIEKGKTYRINVEKDYYTDNNYDTNGKKNVYRFVINNQEEANVTQIFNVTPLYYTVQLSIDNPEQYENIDTLNVELSYKNRVMGRLTKDTLSGNFSIPYYVLDENHDFKIDTAFKVVGTLAGYRDKINLVNKNDIDLSKKQNQTFYYVLAFEEDTKTVLTTVKDENGITLKDAKVEIKDYYSDQSYGTCTTGENGYCKIVSDDLQAKTNYRLVVSKEGYLVTIKTFSINTYDYYPDVTLEKFKGYELKGTLYDGTDVVKDEVTFELLDKDYKLLDTYTSNDGTYKFEGLQIGEETTLFRVRVRNKYRLANDFTYISNESDPVKTLDLHLKKATFSYIVNLSSNFRDKDLTSLDVVVTYKGEVIAKLDKDTLSVMNQFNIEDLDQNYDFKQDEPFIMVASLDGYRDYYVEDTMPEHFFVNAISGTYVKSPLFLKYARIYGTVKDTHNNPIEGATVIVETTDGKQILTAETDQSGNYSIQSELLKNDTNYRVYFKKDGYITSGKDYISILSDILEYRVNQTLAKDSFTIFGTVTDDKGNKLEGVKVIIEDTRNNVLATVKTDKDGQYVITSDKFTDYDGFLVHGEKDGYTFNNSYTVVEVEEGKKQYSASLTLYEEVIEVKDVTVNVTDTDGKVIDQVKVKDENGKVIATVKDGKATFVLADDKAHKLTFVKDGYKEYTAEMQNGNTYSVKLEKEKTEEKPEDKPVPPTEEKPVPPTDTDDKTEVDVPQTDDTTSTAGLVAIMLLCAGGFVVLNKKKKEN